MIQNLRINDDPWKLHSQHAYLRTEDKNGISVRILTSTTYSLVDQPLERDGCEG